MKIRMVLMLAALLVVPTISQATILTFDIRNDNAPPPGGTSLTGSLLTGTYSTYGSNATATSVDEGAHYFNYDMGNGFTPDIGVSYSQGGDANTLRTTIQGGWGNQPVAQPIASTSGASGDRYFVSFSPEATATGVVMNSFELMDYNGNNSYTVDWYVYQESVSVANILASGSTGSFNDVYPNPLEVDTGGVAYIGDVILEIHRTSGLGGNLAFDNVNFDQFTVPEPSSLTLSALALLGFCRLRRVRRRRMCGPKRG